ncbi:MAG TPA: amidohydrolase family protein [Bacteroidales bacterium]|nr:amidohydrolase family protein [Bacteroidales bacterium]
MTRKISAHYIYLNRETFLKFGVVTFSQNGVITSVKDNKGIPEESESLEFFNGIIIPGFVDVDLLQVKTNAVRIFSDGLKDGLHGELFGSFQFLIIENPVFFDNDEVARLLTLEHQGAHIILTFDADPANFQSSIFRSIRKLALTGAIDFAYLLKWSTINPALCMGIDAIYGTIAPNKQPGLNVISGVDYASMSLSETSSIRVIV